MDFIDLFTSLQGRINRAKWWAGEVILFLIFSVTAWIGETIIGQTISTIIWIILYLPAYALTAKRFQDRDKPGETALYGYIPSIIVFGLLCFGPVERDPQNARVQRR